MMKFVNFIKVELVVKNKIAPFHMEMRRHDTRVKCVQSSSKEDANMEKHVLLLMEEQIWDESFISEFISHWKAYQITEYLLRYSNRYQYCSRLI